MLKERKLQAELEVWKRQRPSGGGDKIEHSGFYSAHTNIMLIVFCRDPLMTEEDTVQQVRVK